VSKTNSGRYQIIAGERRWRASKIAGLKTIPAIIKDYETKEAVCLF
ncbi:MAG: ParB N-terminal domain-containing protein, partial [Clostridia bacterium]|nr:ParB N-terminal domain-containing protein [Clostridia bacterium]